MVSAKIVKLTTFFAGLFFVLEFVLPDPFLGVSLPNYSQLILQLITGTAILSLGLGLVSVLSIHGGKVLRLSTGWFYSLTLLAALSAMVFLQSVDWYRSSKNAARIEGLNNLADFAARIVVDLDSGAALDVASRNAALFRALDGVRVDFSLSEQLASRFMGLMEGDLAAQREFTEGVEAELRSAIPELQRKLDLQYKSSGWRDAFSLFYDGMFIPLGAAMFGLLGFYIAAAAYKAFRVRTVESSLMMSAAVLVILGQTPFGALIWDGFTDVRSWLLEVPSKGAFRAIRIGAGVAALVLAFRIWCSIESRSLSGRSRG